MNQNEILKGLDCCADFMCGECPYRKYESKTYPYKCIHKLLVDLKESNLIILPCKIGTKIYRIVPDRSITYPDPPEYKIIWDTFKLSDMNSFGTTVFLSEEEANIEKIKREKGELNA